MSEFKVESGIDVPPLTHETKYPWSEMQPGDSFFIPSQGKKNQRSVQTSAIATAKRWGVKNSGETFISRTVEENGESGVRIWRVA